MRENSMFKVGDKAINVLNDTKVEVQFGPVETRSGNTSYLVKDEQGASSLLWEVDMKPTPRFEVGQVVRSSGVLSKVVAGPFKRQTGSQWYVLEGPDGSQDMEYEDYITPVVE